jgi:hypothetical protein
MQISQQTRIRAARNTARRFGWFSIALGISELLFTRQIARAAGLQGSEGLVRLYGVREIATGFGILLSREEKQAPWMWARVAGDALDVATVASHLRRDNPRALNAAATLVALAPVGAGDFKVARTLSEQRPGQPVRDYSDRTGFPRGTAESRGIAKDVAREALKWMARPGNEVLPTSRVRAMTTPQPAGPAA